jgi:hypothetical protein
LTPWKIKSRDAEREMWAERARQRSVRCVGGEGAEARECEMQAERTLQEPTTSFEIPIISPGLSSFFQIN